MSDLLSLLIAASESFSDVRMRQTYQKLTGYETPGERIRALEKEVDELLTKVAENEIRDG